MLKKLLIKNYALIGNLTVEFGYGDEIKPTLFNNFMEKLLSNLKNLDVLLLNVNSTLTRTNRSKLVEMLKGNNPLIKKFYLRNSVELRKIVNEISKTQSTKKLQEEVIISRLYNLVTYFSNFEIRRKNALRKGRNCFSKP